MMRTRPDIELPSKPARGAARARPLDTGRRQHDGVWRQLVERCGKSLMLWNADGKLWWLSAKARTELDVGERRNQVERAARLALQKLHRTDDATRDGMLAKPSRVGGVESSTLFVEFSWIAGPDGKPWLVAELEERTGSQSALALCSAAETRVLRLLVHGLSNREIGTELGISSETVKTHVKRILSRLGVSSRAKAASMARQVWDDPSVRRQGPELPSAS